MQTKTYLEIASEYSLWMEYADPGGLESEADFDSRPIQEKVELLVKCFGPEFGPETQPAE